MDDGAVWQRGGRDEWNHRAVAGNCMILGIITGGILAEVTRKPWSVRRYFKIDCGADGELWDVSFWMSVRWEVDGLLEVSLVVVDVSNGITAIIGRESFETRWSDMKFACNWPTCRGCWFITSGVRTDIGIRECRELPAAAGSIYVSGSTIFEGTDSGWWEAAKAGCSYRAVTELVNEWSSVLVSYADI